MIGRFRCHRLMWNTRHQPTRKSTPFLYGDKLKDHLYGGKLKYIFNVSDMYIMFGCERSW